MLGMDPVLTGSLCFLVLAILMYVRFIREHPEHEDDELRRRQLHAHAKARKSSPIEPDSVPFLQSAAAPVAAGVLPPQKKQPLSPRQPPGHHGLAVLQKAHQYNKHQQPGYYNQSKQPMRRRAHSAATNNQNNTTNGTTTTTVTHMGMASPPAPSTIADPELGLAGAHYGGDASGFDLGRLTQAGSAPRSSHRIDFGDMEYDHEEAAFFQPQTAHLEQDPLRHASVYDSQEEQTVGFDDDLESRMPTNAVSSALEGELSGPPAPFMIGGGDSIVPAFNDFTAAMPAPTPVKPDGKTAIIERQFVRDSVPPPAQMQLEVARKARIPLFLHSPMYVKTSAAPIDDVLAAEAAAAAANEVAAGVAGKTPRKKDKLPPRCHKNESLHIDYSELRVGEMIGQGAFGTVHKASWRGTTVAVKILVCQYLTADILEEFETEVQIMSILRHPNICLLMGACLEPPTRCLVIEYLPRGSLWNVLRQETVIEYDNQMTFARDTALGMNYLHSFQPPILHRDLKSPNLLVDTSYAIKISDFGLARVRAHFQTMTGNCGTTQWMAPEVLAAEKYTEKADVFSFGVVCWEIITRACPYDGLCQIQAALGVLNNNLRPTIPPTCPPMFKKLMTLCWVSSPERRPTFEQILEFLHSNDESLLDEMR